jgi:methionyl-tRNA formyltransferase
MKCVIFAHGSVGQMVVQYVASEYRDDIGVVVTVGENNVWDAANREGVPCLVFEDTPEFVQRLRDLQADWGILAWWPKLVKSHLRAVTKHGFINTHPSLLPYNRGKHPNFWSIVEGAPFGVSLHLVDDGIDTGDIVAQREIPYGWCDTGESLYAKGLAHMCQLFRQTYPALRAGKFEPERQDGTVATFHKAAELDGASRIELNGTYTARQLLNLMRARTFPGHPACWFEDQGDTFEVTVTIKKRGL